MPVPFLKKWTPQKISTTSPLKPAAPTTQTSITPPPERGLPTLPNELIPVVLHRLDGRSLFRVAQVSRRFNELATRAWLGQHGVTAAQLSSGQVVVESHHPDEAFVALRVALFLRERPIQTLRCALLPAVVDIRVLHQLDALLAFFSHSTAPTELDFGANMILAAASHRSIGKALRRLLCTLTSDTAVSVVVLKDGLFTCRPDALRRWSPGTGLYEGGGGAGAWINGIGIGDASAGATTSQADIHTHDGARQRVPAIRSMETVSVRYPPSDKAFGTWKLITIDATTLTDLQLTLTLPTREWTAILDALLLPSLTCVGLWSTGITTSASTRFFNRHTGIRTLKYMAGAQVHAEEEAPMLCMPNLESLNTVLGYLLYALADVSSSSDSDYRFPRLAHIELRPTPHTLLRPALSLLARQTAAPPVAALTLWSLPADELQDLDGNELWTDIILPGVRVLVLNECKVPVVDLTGLGSFPTLLARVFPALVKLELNYCALGRSASIIKRQTERDSTQAFAEEVRRVFAGERRRLGGVPDRTVNLKLVVDGREV